MSGISGPVDATSETGVVTLARISFRNTYVIPQIVPRSEFCKAVLAEILTPVRGQRLRRHDHRVLEIVAGSRGVPMPLELRERQ